MKRKYVIGAIVMLAMADAWSAPAADRLDPRSTEFATSSYGRWQGLYVGGHFGYGGGNLGTSTNATMNEAEFFPSTVTGFIGGYQVGYNYQLPNNVVLGFEGDVTFVGPRDRKATGLAPFNTTLDYFATARARLGYAFGNFLPYVTGGAAWGQSKVDINDSEGNVIAAKSAAHFGWVAGVGVEYAIDRHWSTNIEYNYIDLATQSYNLGNIAPGILPVDPRLHIVKLGLNYKLDGGASTTSFAPTPPESNDWNIHVRPHSSSRDIPAFARPTKAPRACLEGASAGRPGLLLHFWAGDYGKAVNFTSTLSLRRDLVSAAHWVFRPRRGPGRPRRRP